MDFLSFLMSLGFLRGQGGGGSGGTTNYNALNNKPALNGATLSGSKTGADYGLVDAEAGKGLSANDYTDADKNKLADLAVIKTIGAGLELEANGNLKATGAEIDELDEPFRVKQWSTGSLNADIPCCTQDIENTSIPKVEFSIDNVEGADYQIVGMVAYEVFDADGKRINCWPVCQFTGNGQKTLSVRFMCGGTVQKTAKSINAWVLLKHR